MTAAIPMFLCAAVLVFFRPRIAYGLALAAGLMHYRETMIIKRRDSRVWVSHGDRPLFEYRFGSRLVGTHWPANGQVPAALRSWNAEGWYVVLKDSRMLSSTSENALPVPRIVTELFYELEKLPADHESPVVIRDVCLGFCYDPVAALGFTVLKQRTDLLRKSGVR